METFSALLALCAGNSPVTGEFTSQRQVTQSFKGFFICTWTNGSVYIRDAGDLRRHRAPYDVTVMDKLDNDARHDRELSNAALSDTNYLRKINLWQRGMHK